MIHGELIFKRSDVNSVELAPSIESKLDKQRSSLDREAKLSLEKKKKVSEEEKFVSGTN